MDEKIGVYPGAYSFESFQRYNCLAAFSTGRIDLGFHNNPDIKNNRGIFLEGLNVNPGDLICLKQVHGNKIYLAGKNDRGKGALEYDSAVGGYDGIASRERRLPLGILSADCLALFLFDTRNAAAAIAHAGWRGTRDKISLSALETLRRNFSSSPKDIICALGPCIRSCCCEVKAEFKAYFADGLVKRGNKIFLDIAGANIGQLLEAGIRKENITDSRICTSCGNQDFFSYRKDGKNCARTMAVIMIE